ncbi:unnamed protein product, partial [marine sediment metagenome]
SVKQSLHITACVSPAKGASTINLIGETERL